MKDADATWLAVLPKLFLMGHLNGMNVEQG